MAKKRIIAVLGMHRSGTSALTCGLGALGVGLGDQLNPGNFANPKGYWEDEDVMAVNEAVLAALGSSYHQLGLISPPQLLSAEFETLRERARILLSAKLEGIDLWGFKDPRTPRLLPFWKAVIAELGYEICYVISTRNPISVAQSLLKRDGFSPIKSYYLWLEHLLGALRESIGSPRLVVDYDKLLEQPSIEIERIGRRIGLPSSSREEITRYAEDFLEKDLRHTHHTRDSLRNDPDVPPQVVELYDLLQDFATDEKKMDSPEAAATIDAIWRDWKAIRPALHGINAEAQASRGTTASVQQHISRLQEELAHRENQVAELREAEAHRSEQCVLYQRHVDHLDIVIDNLADANTRLSADIAIATARLQTEQQRLEEILRSHAWQIASRISRFSLRNIARAAIKSLIKGRLRWVTAKFRGAVVGERDSHAGEFDAVYYLKHNPDVAESGADPHEHYTRFGKAEGRHAVSILQSRRDEFGRLDPTRENILIVGHDASRTGAPILTLNIVQNLTARYNVIILMGQDGPLMNDYIATGALIIGAIPLHRSETAEGILAPLLDTYRFRFALVNSIVSRALLPLLAKRYIPNILLVHEFAAYVRPSSAFAEASLWASEIVFSTKLTLASAIEQSPYIARRPFSIIPQGKSVPPSVVDEPSPRQRRNDERLAVLLRRDNAAVGTIFVLGIGTVQMRKGVDIFLQVAERVINFDRTVPFRFVWIGDGFNPDMDLDYSVYLADQIHRAQLQDHVHIVDGTPNIAAAYAAADIVLIPSRLDPLPNVAIDAMCLGVPVICFERTTGIADLLNEAHVGAACVAPYLDVDGMARRVTSLSKDTVLRKQVGDVLRKVAAEQFDLPTYIRRIEELALSIAPRLEQEKQDAAVIAASGKLQIDFALPPEIPKKPLAEAVTLYVRGWATNIGSRKPFPGFHPGIYREHLGSQLRHLDPFAEFVRNGKPTGAWINEVITQKDVVEPIPTSLRVAMHLHVYYADLLPEILRRLSCNRTRIDLLISVPSTEVAAEIAPMLSNYPGAVPQIKIVPNRGRDIAPLLTQFSDVLRNSYDIVGHLHTKKTADIANEYVGRRWLEFLLVNLLGNGTTAMADIILSRMAADPSLGLVFPDDPNSCGWDQNRSFAEDLAARMGITALPLEFNFPVGTMFWARVDALLPLFDLKLAWKDYPSEPLPYDGSMLHAIERLLPFVAAKSGKRYALTYHSGIGR